MAFMSQWSMSSKVWFSPTMPQIKEYAWVPTPEWMDQLGEITAWLVAHDDGAQLGGFAHQMKHHLVLRDVQIQVHFHAALMSVAGHGVPHAALFQLVRPMGELAALHDFRMDVLVDDAVVGVLHVAAGDLAGLGDVDVHGGIGGVRRAERV